MPVFGIPQTYCLVRDFERTVDFYQRLLGFQLVLEVLGTPSSAETLGSAPIGQDWERLRGSAARRVAVLELAGWSLGLIELEGPAPGSPDGDNVGMGAMNLALRVSDVDVEREGLEKAGVQSVSSIKEFEDRTGFSWRWCTFKDPEGNTLALVEDRPIDFDLARMAAAVREGRLARNWTLQDLARRVGLSAPHLSQIERGQSFPSVNALLAIARSMGLPPSRFFEGEAEGFSSRSDASLHPLAFADNHDYEGEAPDTATYSDLTAARAGESSRASLPLKRPAAFFVADELEKLSSLNERGLLTEEEFNCQKAKLLG
jgi:transcriptional regulator with XRE-family HTH domain/predicted enzyme related to lactoylglutathione lyase